MEEWWISALAAGGTLVLIGIFLLELHYRIIQPRRERKKKLRVEIVEPLVSHLQKN
jgi:hypothetical protein